MTTARVSERGQISIPAAARRKLGIKPKSRVIVEVGENEITIRPVRSILEVAGIFRGCTTDIPGAGDWERERVVAMEAVAREVEDECRP